MVGDTRKASHMQFHKAQSIVGEDWAGRHIGAQGNSIMAHNAYFKVPRRLGVPIKTRADFIIADTAKGSFVVVEVKKGVGRVGAGQIPLYLRMSVMAQEHFVEKRLERLEKQFNKLVSSTWSYLFSKRDIKEMGELSNGMLEDSKRMRELAQQLQKTDDES